jgi:mono/diheme cytochrome c family protein
MTAGAMGRLILPALAFAAVYGANAAEPAAKGDPARGRQVYAKWCAECHGRGPGHPGTQSLEVKYRGQTVPAALEDRTDLAPPVTTNFVRHGFALMPQFRKTEISDAQLRDLAAYLAKGK